MTLDQALQPGEKLRIFIGPGNLNNATLHIRAIVDDRQVVYRRWSARKGWRYFVESRSLFSMYVKNGWLYRGRVTVKPEHTTSEVIDG